MIGRFGRLTAAFLVTILGVLLGMSVTPASAAAPTASVAAYTYNGHHHPVLIADTPTERGPPVGGYTDTTTDDSALLWSHGALSRPIGPWSHGDTTYDDRAWPVRGARATATTREQAQVTDGQFVVFDRAGVAANTAVRGGVGPVRVGQAGEAAVRSAYDIGPKATVEIGGRTRILDGLNAEAVSEVKNVAYQAYTQQLRDSLAYAQQNVLRFDLYVRGGANPTTLSGPLEAAVRRGDITLRVIP